MLVKPRTRIETRRKKWSVIEHDGKTLTPADQHNDRRDEAND
jgi:hypothetical protein